MHDERLKSNLELLSRLVGKRTAKHLCTRPLSELFNGEDVPDEVRARLSACRELVRRFTLEDMQRGPLLNNPAVVREHLLTHYAGAEREVFSVLHLDNRHRLIAVEELFAGTIDGASVHPREVVKFALARNAAAVILAHNHPSGVAEPSQADEMITARIRDALALVDIRVLDHLIVGGSTVTSLAERGLI
jgi:DNA repair protein RadC